MIDEHLFVLIRRQWFRRIVCPLYFYPKVRDCFLFSILVLFAFHCGFLKFVNACFEEKEDSRNQGYQCVGSPHIENGLTDEVCVLVVLCLLLLLFVKFL